MTVDGQTSIGPAEPKPEAKPDENPSIVPGVDAQAANEADMRRGLAGAEAKPFSEAATPSRREEQARQAAKQSDHEAVSSETAEDPNAQDPDARSDMESERREPGRHGGGGDSAWKPSR
jgi:hypothetical protein